MEQQEKDELYHKIDSDEEMSDKEKREAYFSEIEERERWENEQSGYYGWEG